MRVTCKWKRRMEIRMTSREEEGGDEGNLQKEKEDGDKDD